jgi:lipopolysaccharide export system permease protein
LIFAATQILAIGRAVSEAHAPLFAAIEDFVWQLPFVVVFVIPMALLLGTLLAIQRLSGESEITAMKAGGIPFSRVVAPLLAAGFLMSIATYALQEAVVPFANAHKAQIESEFITHTNVFNRDLFVQAPLPGGGRQVTFASAIEPNTGNLIRVTLLQYDRSGAPTQVAFADNADFQIDHWTLRNVSIYRFESNGQILAQPNLPALDVQIGEKPAQILKRVANDNPDDISRSQVKQLIESGQLTPVELRKYLFAYHEKLARPFACFVFTLIAVPFGLRSPRGGSSTGLGFGLAVLIVFIYYITFSIFTALGEAFPPIAALAAWMPNIIFTVIGAFRLQKAASV